MSELYSSPSDTFPGVPAPVLEAFLNDPRSKSRIFPAKAYIARQGTNMHHLHLLLKGSAKTVLLSDDGNILSMEVLHAPHIMAPAFLFAQHSKTPLDMIALEESEVLQVAKECVLEQMMSNKEFLENFLLFSASRSQFLLNRIQTLIIKTIKGKIAFYILERLKPDSKLVDMERNQTELSEYFGVTRPSLARSIGEMEDEGLIKIKNRQVMVFSADELRRLV